MLAHDLDLTCEQRASLAKLYRFMAARIVWAGGVNYDPRARFLVLAREMERGEALHVHEAGVA